jgi:hypothetical protein
LWYKTLVLKGAEEHRLPDYYISEIKRIEFKTDPERMRAKKNLAVLG